MQIQEYMNGHIGKPTPQQRIGKKRIGFFNIVLLAPIVEKQLV